MVAIAVVNTFAGAEGLDRLEAAALNLHIISTVSFQELGLSLLTSMQI